MWTNGSNHSIADAGSLTPNLSAEIAKGEIQSLEMKLGGKTGQDYKDLIVGKEHCVLSENAEHLLLSSDFERCRLKRSKKIVLVRVALSRLGFSDYARADQIVGTKESGFTDGVIHRFGLIPCPPDVGPELCLLQQRPFIASVMMQPIIDCVFSNKIAGSGCFDREFNDKNRDTSNDNFVLDCTYKSIRWAPDCCPVFCLGRAKQ